MRVLLLCPNVPISDTQKGPINIMREIKGLTDLGCKLFIVSGSESALKIRHTKFDSLASIVRQTRALDLASCFFNNIKVFWKVFLANPRLAIRVFRKSAAIARYCKINKIAVINSHWAFPDGTCGALAARYARIPVVATLRGVEINTDPSTDFGNRKNRAYESYLRTSLKQCDATVVASSTSLRSLVKLTESSANVFLIPNDLDIRFASIANDPAKEHPSGKQADLIITASNLYKNKKVDVIIKAFANVLSRSPRFKKRLVVVGDGPELTNLKSFASELGIQDRVQFLGAVLYDDMPGLLRGASLFVFASASEGFGNAIIEAMAMNTPVLTSKVGVIEDFFNDNQTCLIHDGTPEHLAEQMELAFSRPNYCMQLAENAKSVIMNEFSVSRRSASILKVLESVCDELE